MHDENDLAYWFPRLRSAHVNVPKTVIVQTESDLSLLLDGKTPADLSLLIQKLAGQARMEFGFPCFLRTGHASGKHEWRLTCYVKREEDLGDHIARLVEWSALASIMGLPTQTWVLRELLKTKPAFTAFYGMPINREFRFFFRRGDVVHWQPYWPPDSIRNPSCDDWEERLRTLSALSPDELTTLEMLTEKVAKQFNGEYWSLDWLQVGQKWYAIDMARGEESFRWNAPETASWTASSAL